MTHYFLYRVILISSKRETQNKRKEKVLRRIQIMYYNGEYYTDDDIEGSHLYLMRFMMMITESFLSLQRKLFKI